jgi:hypothetical protein
LILDIFGATYLFECPIGRRVWSTIPFDNCDVLLVDVRLHCRHPPNDCSVDGAVGPTRHTKTLILRHGNDCGGFGGLSFWCWDRRQQHYWRMIMIRIRTMILYCSTSVESSVPRILLRLSDPKYCLLLRPSTHHSHRITIPHHLPLPIILATLIVLVLAPTRSLQDRHPGITPMPISILRFEVAGVMRLNLVSDFDFSSRSIIVSLSSDDLACEMP